MSQGLLILIPMSDGNASTWIPLSARESEESRIAREALVEDFPDWLEPSVLDWLSDAVAYADPRHAERMLRTSLPDERDPFHHYWDEVWGPQRVDLIDYLLHVLHKSHVDRANGWPASVPGVADTVWSTSSPQSILVRQLEVVLSEGGSAWRVADRPSWGLQRRVHRSELALLESVAAEGQDAGRAIEAAWNHCYKPHPDCAQAYNDAVTAVEACVIPVAIPNDAKGTLGKAIAHMRATSDRWEVGGLRGTRRASETLVAMLETLWQGQIRHANHGGAVSRVTQREAEAAVSLALTIVHWFTADLVTRH